MEPFKETVLQYNWPLSDPKEFPARFHLLKCGHLIQQRTGDRFFCSSNCAVPLKFPHHSSSTPVPAAGRNCYPEISVKEIAAYWKDTEEALAAPHQITARSPGEHRFACFQCYDNTQVSSAVVNEYESYVQRSQGDVRGVVLPYNLKPYLGPWYNRIPYEMELPVRVRHNAIVRRGQAPQSTPGADTEAWRCEAVVGVPDELAQPAEIRRPSRDLYTQLKEGNAGANAHVPRT